LFNDAVSSVDYVTLNDRMINEQERLWYNLRYCPEICLERQENWENLHEGSWSLDQDLNPGPLKYEAGMVTTEL
jgi:hypothetical protein